MCFRGQLYRRIIFNPLPKASVDFREIVVGGLNINSPTEASNLPVIDEAMSTLSREGGELVNVQGVFGVGLNSEGTAPLCHDPGLSFSLIRLEYAMTCDKGLIPVLRLWCFAVAPIARRRRHKPGLSFRRAVKLPFVLKMWRFTATVRSSVFHHFLQIDCVFFSEPHSSLAVPSGLQ
ncbi:hypothetical protein LENED_007734 [Lentinula edodes]|uniref:Uncharacterized protein n=1 Tax=Lentinula edodes TaxID=5353 RepID=A0A1Q3EFB9_LENED|nr:hypothetical protein LENED_007734 [Lentinula edodes]